MRQKKILLAVALTLIMSAIAAQAANMQISFLPFPITAPGTYVFASDLSYTGTATAITITPNLPGPVILNLKGHVLSGSGGSNITTENFSTGISIHGSGPSAASITIENGTVRNFGFGITAGPTFHQSGLFFSDIHINNIFFTHNQTPVSDGWGIGFQQVNSSTVSNCTFNIGDDGIADYYSNGGNRYTNESFTNMSATLIFLPGSPTSILEDCRFQTPTN